MNPLVVMAGFGLAIIACICVTAIWDYVVPGPRTRFWLWRMRRRHDA